VIDVFLKKMKKFVHNFLRKSCQLFIRYPVYENIQFFLGRDFAHALGEAGAAVAVAALHKETAETVADELEKKGIDSIAITADVKKIDNIERIIKTVVDHWGSLTIGVNNAGVGAWVDAVDVTRADWDEIMVLI
jgi:NAD(P)-dependent dehydrogenase (short-subunit alcohol dehydrogenase family)